MLIEEFSEGNLNFPPVTVWTKKFVSEWRPLLVFASTVRSNSRYKRPVRIARLGDVDSSVCRVKWVGLLAQSKVPYMGPCLNRWWFLGIALRIPTVHDFASSARACVQNVRDFPQTKLDSEINAPFLLNEHGDPLFLFHSFNEDNILHEDVDD